MLCRSGLPVRAEAMDVIAALTPVFRADPAITMAILFGSQARGEAGVSSDVDIAIIADNPRLVNRRMLNYTAEEYEIETNFVYTTPQKISLANHELDVNYWIREEGIVLWQR